MAANFRRKLLRYGLLIVAVLLILDVIEHPSGSGNPACYPNLTCYHHARVTHVRGHR